MDDQWAIEQRAGLRREQAVTALLPLFFVSGATALVYQTIWNRELHLLFGTSSFAIATVLSAFMAGLALGGILMARVADQVGRPLRVYGLLEVGIGLYAFIFPSLLALVAPLYLEMWRALQPGPVLFGVIQFLVVGALLLLPTAAMGATLPLLARFATSSLGAAGDRIGTLYAINTAGAVFGTWAAGFFLLPTYGLWFTTTLAALANLVLGLAAVALDHWNGAERVTVEPMEISSGTEATPFVLVALGLAGFASLVYEVAWTRVMALMVGASVYGFSVMLLAFLIGIAVGGKVGGRLADGLLRRYGLLGVLAGLGAVELMVAGLSYGLMYVFGELPFWYVWLFDALDASQRSTGVFWISLLLSGVIMTPPALFMGIAFPMAVRAVVGDQQGLGGPVGRVYAANTIGGVGGAFAAGFLLLPTVGVQWTVLIAAWVNVLAATVALWSVSPRARLIGPVAAGVFALGFAFVRPPWDPLIMTSGMYHYVTDFDDHSRAGIERHSKSWYDLLFYEEGLSSVVTVGQNRKSRDLWLANNGKVDASTTSDLPTQVLCSLLPMQFAAAHDDVVVIGLASGITAGAVATLPTVKRLEIVELEPAIERAARFFGPHNGHVLDDPRVTLVANDGRNHLLMAAPGSYDVIVSEPSNPWITGVSNLFTREFWEMGKTRLKPGGVWSQWVQLYGMEKRDVQSLLGTFADVYPHVIVYETIDVADLILVGSETPLIPDPARGRVLLRSEATRRLLLEVAVKDRFDLVAPFQMDRDDVLAATVGVPRNTDDNMRIEYNAPLNLHADTHRENRLFLLDHVALPDLELYHGDWADLARAFHAREDLPRAVLSYNRALLALGNDDPGTWMTYILEREVLVETVKAAAAAG